MARGVVEKLGHLLGPTLCHAGWTPAGVQGVGPEQVVPGPVCQRAHTGPSQGGRGGFKNYSLAYRRVGSSNCEPFCGLLLWTFLVGSVQWLVWFLPFKFCVLW